VTRQPRISVRRVADKREEIGDQSGRHAELLSNTLGVEDFLRPAIDLDDSIFDDALGKILVDGPDAHFLDAPIPGGDPCRRRQSVVGFELDHRPYLDTHCFEGLFQWVELGEKDRLDSLAGLVVGPKVIAERFDYVIGRDADMRGALL
jgi:hypothetical protein